MGTLTEADGHDPRMVCSPEGFAAGPDGNGALASRIPAMADAAPEASDAFAGDAADLEEAAALRSGRERLIGIFNDLDNAVLMACPESPYDREAAIRLWAQTFDWDVSPRERALGIPNNEMPPHVCRCDWCSALKPSEEVLPRGDLLLCEDCRETPPSVDRKIDLMRGK